MLHLMHTRDQTRELRPVPPGHTVHPVLIWSSVTIFMLRQSPPIEDTSWMPTSFGPSFKLRNDFPTVLVAGKKSLVSSAMAEDRGLPPFALPFSR
jgi:hypothetical protein